MSLSKANLSQCKDIYSKKDFYIELSKKNDYVDNSIIADLKKKTANSQTKSCIQK